jgi:hypothetical protein
VKNLAQEIADVAFTSENRAVTDRVMRQQAVNLGAKIQTEDGIANAVRVIESIGL